MSGERKDIAGAKDAMTRRLVEGGMPAAKAEQIARQQAQKADRRERDK
jgi:hypothetical protein